MGFGPGQLCLSTFLPNFKGNAAHGIQHRPPTAISPFRNLTPMHEIREDQTLNLQTTSNLQATHMDFAERSQFSWEYGIGKRSISKRRFSALLLLRALSQGGRMRKLFVLSRPSRIELLVP
jgi:hypothetical protein